MRDVSLSTEGVWEKEALQLVEFEGVTQVEAAGALVPDISSRRKAAVCSIDGRPA